MKIATLKSVLLCASVLWTHGAWAEPITISVSDQQAQELAQLGLSKGMTGVLAYKRLHTMALEFPTVTEPMPWDAGQLLEPAKILNLGVGIGPNDFTIDVSQRLSKGFELPLQGPNMPAKVAHNLLLKGRYLIYIKRGLEASVKAFIPMETGAPTTGWLGSEKTFDENLGQVRLIRYTVLKDGYFKQLCSNSAHVVAWSLDHIEVQTVDSDCREVDSTDLGSAKAEVKKAANEGKPKFIWLNQGRQSVDFIRITNDITAVYVRNLGQVYTHKAMFGIDVGLDKVLPSAEDQFREFMVSALHRLGISKVKPKDLHY